MAHIKNKQQRKQSKIQTGTISNNQSTQTNNLRAKQVIITQTPK